MGRGFFFQVVSFFFPINPMSNSSSIAGAEECNYDTRFYQCLYWIFENVPEEVKEERESLLRREWVVKYHQSAQETNEKIRRDAIEFYCRTYECTMEEEK